MQRRWSFLILSTFGLGEVLVMLLLPASVGLEILHPTLTCLGIIFLVLYSSRSNWRETAPGRALMYVMSTVTMLGFYLTLVSWFGEGNQRRWGLLLVLFGVGLLNLNMTLLRLQGEARHGSSVQSARRRRDSR